MKEKETNKWIAAIAVILPLAVAIVYYLPKGGETNSAFLAIPKFNAILNGATFVTLVAGLVAIKSGRIMLHRNLMLSAIIMSALFLVGYVIYHSQVPSTEFLGQGIIRTVYFTILITHIILAAVIAPLVLVTLARAIKGDFEKHKKIARWTYPIWLYVSLTGLMVYLLISPYY